MAGEAWLYAARHIFPSSAKGCGAPVAAYGWYGELKVHKRKSIVRVGWLIALFINLRAKIKPLYVVFAIHSNLRIRLANMLISHQMSLNGEVLAYQVQRLHQYTKMMACSPVRLSLAFGIDTHNHPTVATHGAIFSYHLFNHMARHAAKQPYGVQSQEQIMISRLPATDLSNFRRTFTRLVAQKLLSFIKNPPDSRTTTAPHGAPFDLLP